ncbi:MAG: family 10 glycosylhydrolase [Acidobacteriota bacterium]|nr:family 10 glycosylhydrolase [Acidobacteriota bacterium]MDH3783905.1 family 10 glycosylhydrolase [Acidobacteriota bacterium]
MRSHATQGTLVAWLVVLWIAGAVCQPSVAGDGVTLTVSRGPAASQVTLSWSGKQPDYEIYRSVDPGALPGVAAEIAQTLLTTWTDSPPAGDLWFYNVTSRPQVLDDLLASSTDLAGSMETLRMLDESILYGGQFINSAEFLHLSSRSLLAMTSEDPFPPPQAPAGLIPPNNPYPGITLEDTYYDRPFTRDEYLALLRQLDDVYIASGEYPSSLTVQGTTAEVRYAELVYYAAGLLRAREFQGYLPELWNRYIISAEGLVPWSTPAGFEDYTSALEQSDGTAFFPNHSRRYYGSSAHQYSMLKLARDIYGNTHNAYQAGEKFYDWCLDQWLNTVGYTSGKTQFWGDRSGWEIENHFFHTSGVPRKIISHLFRTVGIPSSTAGAAYFSNQGWINIDTHAPYGSDPLDNSFYYDPVPPGTKNMPHPTSGDDFIARINAVSGLEPVPAAVEERTSVYINPRDVLDYGAPYVVDQSGDFDTLVLTVKSLKGYLYFSSSGWAVREQSDALGPLIQEAHARGKKVYAGFATLADRQTAGEQPDWLQKLNEYSSGGYPNLNLSPCVQAYEDQLVTLLQNLVSNYEVDGVVLDYLFFANLFGNTDTMGHADCPNGPSWMADEITDYATTLINTIKAVDPDVETVVTGYPFAIENRYYGLSPVEVGHQDLQALAQVADEIMLVFPGTYWVPIASPYWQTAIFDIRALTGTDPWVSFQIVDEWEYTPRFYRGLARFVRQSGISGFNLHTTLSGLGELSPALTRSQWEKIRAAELH